MIRRSKDLKNHKGRPASYDTAKDQLGMVAYQVRKWVGWHRHVTLCLLAAAFLAVTRASRGNQRRPGKARRSAESAAAAVVDRGDPWAAGRDHTPSRGGRHGCGRPRAELEHGHLPGTADR